jgi:uncharacterized protein YdaU (DUF1376 family)
VSTSPWTKFYASDWLNGARALSLQERGLYITLIAMMYDEGGPIVGSDERFARLCGCKVSEFQKGLAALVAEGKIIKTERGLWNNRVQKELGKIQEKSAKQSDNAKSRWSKNPDISTSGECHGINLAVPTECLLEARSQNKDISSLRSDSASEEKPFPKAKKEPSRFDEFWSIYPKRDGSNPKEPARQKFDLACKRGADPQAIISAAQRYAEQQKRLGNIGSPYVKQAVSWLNAQSWKDDYGSASASASDDYAKQREFLARLPASQLIGYVQQFYQKRFVWKVDLMGPPPSSPDTLVPPEMINEAKEGVQHEQMGSQSAARGGMPVNRIYNVA